MSAPGITVARLCSACGQVRPCPPGAVGAPWRCAACAAPALTDSPTGAPPDWVHPSMVADEGETDGAATARDDEPARLRRVIERDRTAYAGIVTALRREVASRRGMAESRGSYEWDDDDYRKEFARALDAIVRKLDAMERETHLVDWSDSPMSTAEVTRARRGDVYPPDVAALTAERDALARLAEDRRAQLLLCAELFARSPWPEMHDQARAIRAEHGRGR